MLRFLLKRSIVSNTENIYTYIDTQWIVINVIIIIIMKKSQVNDNTNNVFNIDLKNDCFPATLKD